MTVDELIQAWRAFVWRWDAAGGARNTKSARALIGEVLVQGLTEPENPVDEPSADLMLACEVATIRQSGEVDEQSYRWSFADLPDAVADPVSHFCAAGWQMIFNPRPGFNVWWYWVEHLDPERELINPLLHYLLLGKRAGLSAIEPTVDLRPGINFAANGPPVRRACLFAGYDPDGIVDDYVLAYIRELVRHADVYYLADSTMSSPELDKLADVTEGAWAIRHGLYDFGSWSVLAGRLVGWDALGSYDEVLFVNDSAYLLRPLDEVFARMDQEPCDWWGLHPTKRTYARDNGNDKPLPLPEALTRWRDSEELNPVDHLHLSSYFLAFRRGVIDDPGFRRRIESVTSQATKPRVIFKYELGLSRYLLQAGYRPGAFIDDLYPYLPIYTTDYWELVARGFPLLKRNLLSDNLRQMPDLEGWKKKISALVPGAQVEMFEHNLLRVTGEDQRYRSFAIRGNADGTVDYHRPLTWERFRMEDRWAPKFDHWWAFPVCAYDHNLGGNERAVFERVRDDPSIKKIILTRSRRVDLGGLNVEVVPLISPEGQHYLARARQIFVKHGPNVNAHWPISPITHNFINLWHGIPLKRFGSASAEITQDLEGSFRRNNSRCRAVITSSKIDTLAMATAFWPLSYPDMWNTGLPRNDFVLCPSERLPKDLRAIEQMLRAELAERRLVIFAPTFKDSQADAYYRFTDGDLEWLSNWMARHNAVLGVREHMADRARTYWHQLAPLGSIDLSSRRFPDLEVMYRVATGLVSDYSSCLIDFLATGKPVASFAYDLDRYSQKERGLFHDLKKVLPGPVCESFDDLSSALDGFFEEVTAADTEEYQWRRQIFFDRIDDRAADRVAERVRSLYERPA